MPERICTRCATPIPLGATRCTSATCAATPRLSGRTRQDLNRRVLIRDGYVCQLRILCAGAIADCVDHTIPLADGGQNTMSNMRAACSPCNQRKGARSYL